jgi:chitin disaccharide deacetylase
LAKAAPQIAAHRKRHHNSKRSRGIAEEEIPGLTTRHTGLGADKSLRVIAAKIGCGIRGYGSEMDKMLRISLAVSLLFLAGVACGPGSHAQSMPTTNATKPEDSRRLIIEAEDLGMAHSIDNASFVALDKGWVTSASILVPAPWFPEVAFWANQHHEADLGVQVDLTSDWKNYSWRPVSPQAAESSLIDSKDYFPLTEMYVARHANPEEAKAEARAQIELALKTGIPVTHLDNHMRVMTTTPRLFQVYWDLGQEFNLPILVPNQQIRNQGRPTADGNVYNFGGVDVNVLHVPVERVFEMMPGIAKQDWLSAYEKSLTGLPPGVYLLSVHLGYDNDELQAMTWDHPNWGAQWRQNDFDVISNPEFHKFLKQQGFTLVTWRDLRKAIPAQNAWK